MGVAGRAEETTTDIEIIFTMEGIRLRPAVWLKDAEYQEAIDKLGTLTSAEIRQLGAESLTIVVDYRFYCLPGILVINYRALLSEIKQFITDSASVVREWRKREEVAGQEAAKLEKTIREKGLNICQSAGILNEEYLTGLKTLNQLSAGEIAKLNLGDQEVVVSFLFRINDNRIKIDYRASLGMIVYFLTNLDKF